MTTVPRAICLLLLLAAALLPAAAQQESSENNPRLKRLLQRFPEADANKDGVLTREEALAFMRKRFQTLLPGKPKPTHAAVKYGPHQRNVLDLWLARSEQPTPLVLYIHGGGFVAGSRTSLDRRMIEACLKRGISIAAIDYRFVNQAIFPAPQMDGARAVQFLRHKAEQWKLDHRRFAAYGGSAGAGISIWLAFRNDLADPFHVDPVLRESTRLQAVGSIGGQTSYDPRVIREWIGGKAWQHSSITKCYGVKSYEALDDPKLQKLYDEVSAIKHVSQGDPPVYMLYAEPDRPLPENARPGQGIHHPIFGHKLKAELDKLGIEAVYRHRSQMRGKDPLIEMIEFFQKHWKGTTPR